MKEKCLQAYKRCYSKCYRALSACPCVNNLEFELHPFLCIMLQMSLVECDQSLWKGIYDYALRQIKPDQFSVFRSRIELYFAVIKGDYEPRAEWALGGPVDSKNLLTKPIIVFGDILVNPDCASDYKNAPICLQSIFDMRRFTLTYMQKVVPIIADEFSPLAPADSSSKKNPVHTVSIDSRTTVSTPESRRREQRVEQEQRKSAIGKVVSWVIAFREKDSYGKFLDECDEVISEYGFDSSYLVQLKAMVKETKKSKQPLPDEPVKKLACTCVFNSVAQDLMLHKYNLSDLGFNPLGEIYLSSLSKLGADMVSLCYVSKEEMNELLDNIVRVSLEYASKDIVEHFCDSVRIN